MDRFMFTVLVLGSSAAATLVSCGHGAELRDRERTIAARPASAPSLPYRPVRSAVEAPKLVGGKRVPPTNPRDRPIETPDGLVRFQDKTIAKLVGRTLDDGGLEWVTTWRSNFPVRALVSFAHGLGLCLASEDGRVGCVEPTNHHGAQMHWLFQEQVRSLAVFRGAGWQLCFVRNDGSSHCDPLPETQPIEEGDTLTFKSSTPSANDTRYAQWLTDAFGKLGKLKKIFADPNCAIDAANRLFCLEDKGARLVLDGVLDATANCALMLDHSVRCWGENQYGQVGMGRRSRTEAVPMAVAGLKDIEQITSSGINACARRKDGAVFCWGTQFGPDFLAAAVNVPTCRIQDRPPVDETVEAPCPPVSGRGDDLCRRTRYNAQRLGGQDAPIVLRDEGEQCAGPGEDYVPTPTRITVVDEAASVFASHGAIYVVRSDGIVVEAASTIYREIAVRTSPPVR